MVVKSGKQNGRRSMVSNRRAIPQQQRSRERVATILAVTSRLLGEVGFDVLNTRQIAAAAHLPPSLVYHYFPNKQSIVKALAEQTVVPLRDQLAQSLTEVKIRSWREAIRGLVDKMTSTYRRVPGAGAIVQALQSDPDLIRFNREMNDQFARMFVRFFQAAGADADPSALLRAGRLILLIFDAITFDLVSGSRRDAAKLSAEVSDLLIAYLRKYLR
jgi:AcrR family transcriptional regulator